MPRAFRFENLRLRSAFAPRKPRHPLLRLAFGLIGLALICLLLVFGLFLGAAMLAGGLLFKLLRHRRKPVQPIAARGSNVVDGEYRVVRRPAVPLAR
jgi:hypothetical protein